MLFLKEEKRRVAILKATVAFPVCALSHLVVSEFCDSVDRSPPDSSVHRIFQAILECVAISYSRGSSRPRDQT